MALLGIHFSHSNENVSHKNLYTCIHRSSAPNNWKLKTTLIPFNAWMIKQIYGAMEYYSTIKKEQTCYITT